MISDGAFYKHVVSLYMTKLLLAQDLHEVCSFLRSSHFLAVVLSGFICSVEDCSNFSNSNSSICSV